MTVSIRRMSLGSGYEYLLNSVARGDSAQPKTSALTRYYAESGTPPGRMIGSGLAGLDDGRGIAEGTEVTEKMLFHMLGMLTDPLTALPLGRRPHNWPTPLTDRVRTRVGELPATLSSVEKAAQIARIEFEENERERHLIRPVAGFDLTFSVPKSVSTVWALADGATQAVIYEAHQDAVLTALRWAEQNMFFSRSGANGLVQEEIRGIIAAAFDHWDSRAGDPHLHTHVAVMNRAQSMDGTWRTLDSRGLFKYVVALSELHEGVLADLLTDRLGWGWDERARRHSPVPRHDVAGVADNLIAEFSQRSAQIELAKTDLVAQFVAARGHQPSTVELLRLRQQATLQTRPDKHRHSLRELTDQWRSRARAYVGDDTVAWVATLRDRCDLPALSEKNLQDAILTDAAAAALAVVGERRATFTHANVLAEVHRQLHGVRFRAPEDRIAVADRTVALALENSIQLTPPEDGPVPEALRRADGTSKLRFRGAEIYTTKELLEAEARLLDTGRQTGGAGVPTTVIVETIEAKASLSGRRLGADQAAAINAVATSGRVLDLLVGPAGAGKTASLAVLRAAWERQYGAGSVVGLAPSAAAANVLADELGIDTENTAKWLTEIRRAPDRTAQLTALRTRLSGSHNRGSVLSSQLTRQISRLESELARWSIRPGQLLILDEASLAGTYALDEIVAHCAAASGKILLAGDWAQLSAIDAGGAFAMLVRDRSDVPELTAVRRFINEWERAASVQLRAGDANGIAEYERNGRVHGGRRLDMLDAIYTGWRNDIDAGRTSLMIAGDAETVNELNRRARLDRMIAGHVVGDGATIAGDTKAGVGDRVVTRRNERRLAVGHGWVKNGDSWTVRNVAHDGSLMVEREIGNGRVVLPAAYVRRHVELGYAATAYRAQGRTVETSHVLVAPTTTREVLYVAATRGRLANHIYVDTRYDPDIDTSHGSPIEVTPSSVLVAVLGRTGSDTAAHSVLTNQARRSTTKQTEIGVARSTAGDATTAQPDLTPVSRTL